MFRLPIFIVVVASAIVPASSDVWSTEVNATVSGRIHCRGAGISNITVGLWERDNFVFNPEDNVTQTKTDVEGYYTMNGILVDKAYEKYFGEIAPFIKIHGQDVCMAKICVKETSCPKNGALDKPLKNETTVEKNVTSISIDLDIDACEKLKC